MKTEETKTERKNDRGRKLEKRKGVEENKIEKRGRNMRKWYQKQKTHTNQASWGFNKGTISKSLWNQQRLHQCLDYCLDAWRVSGKGDSGHLRSNRRRLPLKWDETIPLKLEGSELLYYTPPPPSLNCPFPHSYPSPVYDGFHQPNSTKSQKSSGYVDDILAGSGWMEQEGRGKRRYPAQEPTEERNKELIYFPICLHWRHEKIEKTIYNDLGTGHWKTVLCDVHSYAPKCWLQFILSVLRSILKELLTWALKTNRIINSETAATADLSLIVTF